MDLIARRPAQRNSFAEDLSRRLLRTVEHALAAETLAGRDGLLQRLDPRAKLVAGAALIVSGVLTHALGVVVGVFALALVLARLSRIALLRLFGPLWLSVLLFTGGLALPALFVVPGETLAQLPLLDWTLTRQGVYGAALLVARALTSATLALLLVATTPWPQLLKALRALGVPVVVVAMLAMTQRYIFVLMHSAAQLAQARRSRCIAALTAAQQRRMAIASAGVLLEKAVALADEVHLAMLSRGYRGEVRLLDEFVWRLRDSVALACALAVPLAILWLE
jgi:cobalt ECF transporter T component CbiQ